MKLAIYTITRDRLDYTKQMFSSLKSNAGMDHDHYVWDNGSSDGTKLWLQSQKLASVVYSPHNVGQQVAANSMLEQIRAQDYTHVIRMDNDCFVRSDKLLPRILECSSLLDDKAILSPRVLGLKWQPPRFAEKRVGKYDLGFVEILGGICRLHPIGLLEGFTFDVRRPMGLGEADQMCTWAQTHRPPIAMAYVENLFVTHGESTEKQEKANPAYFEEHAVLQSWPYVPAVA
jgi:glycosyltransferase involved in cell wall biosynthesis